MRAERRQIEEIPSPLRALRGGEAPRARHIEAKAFLLGFIVGAVLMALVFAYVARDLARYVGDDGWKRGSDPEHRR